MRSTQFATLSSGKKRQASRRIVHGFLMASTALVAVAPTGAFAVDLTVDGSTQTITDTQSFDGILVGENLPNSVLNINSGGDVSASDSEIGANSGSEGTITVSGSGSTLVLGASTVVAMSIGSEGTGTLNVYNGAEVDITGGLVLLGDDTGSNGTVTVSGSGSKLTNNTSSIVVGNSGTGTLTVSNGGSVSNNDIAIVMGSLSSGAGTAIVTGSGSRLTSANVIRVGNSGQGTLTVSDGGVASAGGSFTIAENAGSNGTINIGAAAGDPAAAAGKLEGANGGTAAIAFGAGTGAIVFNHTETDYDFNATVSGEGDIFVYSGTTTFSNTVNIGSANFTVDGGELKIAGTTIGDLAHIGQSAGTHGTITVSGPGSSLTPDGGLRVGGLGTGTLNVNNGASVHTDGQLQIGVSAGSSGTVTVSGAGSELDTDDNNIFVGLGGAGTLTVSDGGSVVNEDVIEIGSSAASVGTVVVSGSGSLLEAGDDIVVGRQGQGTLTVSDGGAARADRDFFVGASAGSNGAVTITGAGSLLTVSRDLFVGASGTGTLMVSDGGVARADNAFIGQSAGSSGTITVLGSGSSLMTETIRVGNNGTGTLNVYNGAEVNLSSQIDIGFVAGSTGTVTVSGSGSKLTSVSGANFLGLSGTGMLTVSNGGSVSTTGNLLMGQSGSGVGTAVVTGSGSRLASDGGIFVGGSGQGTLTASDGGVASASTGFSIAGGAGSDGILNIGAAAGDPAAAAGTLEGANGGAATVVFGAGTGQIVFNHTETNYNFNANVSGNGTFSQNAGFTSLTGNFTGFTGSANVSGGTLSIDTDFVGDISVLSGGTLAGAGSAGAISFASGSTLEVALGSGSFLTGTDAINIANGSTLSVVNGGTSNIWSTTTVLTGASVTGTFDTVDTAFKFLDTTVTYNATSVLVAVARNGTAFSTFAETPNQAAVADAVESLPNGNAVYDAFVLLESAAEIADALKQLSGEAHPSTQASVTQSAGMTRDIITSRIRSAFSIGGTNGSDSGSSASNYAPLGYAEEPDDASAFDTVMTGSTALAHGYDYWGDAYGSFGKTLGSGGTDTTERATGGVLTGIETGYGTDWRVGGVLGYSHTQTDVGAVNSQTGMDSFTAGAYAGRSYGALRVQYGAAASINKMNSERHVVFGGLNETLKADYNAATLQAFGEVGYALPGADGVEFEPFAGAALVYQHTGGFTETGGASALTSSASSTTLAITTIGVRGAFDLGRMSDGTAVALHGSAAWNHTFGDMAPTTAMAFAGGSTSFTVAGNSPARDIGLINLGLDFAVKPDMSIAVDYTGAFGKNQHDQTFSAKLKAQF